MDLKRNNTFFRSVATVACITVVLSTMPTEAYTQVLPHLGHQSAVPPTPSTQPLLLQGVVINPEKPFDMHFLIDEGQFGLSDQDIEIQSARLLRYFLTVLTMSAQEMWVNLSPHEADRVVYPESLAQTELGRDLLEQDYQLKQLTASLMDPDTPQGKTFWDKVYAEAYARYGTTEVPVNTFHKVWITPATGKIYAKDNTAYVIESRLKVMLERDYLAEQYNRDTRYEVGGMQDKTPEDGLRRSTYHVSRTTHDKDDLSSDIIRTIIIPLIEEEVNTGTTFTRIRQIYNTFLLAAWLKGKIRDNVMVQLYANQDKYVGIDVSDPNVIDAIYNQYVQTYSEGMVNEIREEYDAHSQTTVSRHYFTGGVRYSFSDQSMTVSDVFPDALKEKWAQSSLKRWVDARFRPNNNDVDPNEEAWSWWQREFNEKENGFIRQFQQYANNASPENQGQFERAYDYLIDLVKDLTSKTSGTALANVLTEYEQLLTNEFEQRNNNPKRYNRNEDRTRLFDLLGMAAIEVDEQAQAFLKKAGVEAKDIAYVGGSQYIESATRRVFLPDMRSALDQVQDDEQQAERLKRSQRRRAKIRRAFPIIRKYSVVAAMASMLTGDQLHKEVAVEEFDPYEDVMQADPFELDDEQKMQEALEQLSDKNKEMFDELNGKKDGNNNSVMNKRGPRHRYIESFEQGVSQMVSPPTQEGEHELGTEAGDHDHEHEQEFFETHFGQLLENPDELYDLDEIDTQAQAYLNGQISDIDFLNTVMKPLIIALSFETFEDPDSVLNAAEKYNPQLKMLLSRLIDIYSSYTIHAADLDAVKGELKDFFMTQDV